MGVDINVHDQCAWNRWAHPGPQQGASRHTDKAIVQYRRLLRQEIEKDAGGEKPIMILDAAQARGIQGPAAMDGIGPTRGWENYWMEVDVKRRSRAPWARRCRARSRTRSGICRRLSDDFFTSLRANVIARRMHTKQSIAQQKKNGLLRRCAPRNEA